MLLEGKKAIILGVANEYSIAWGIAKQLKAHGASIAISYLNDSLKRRVEPLAEEIGADFIFELDVTNEEHHQAMADMVKERWGEVDILIHSLAFADRNDLQNRFHVTSRQGFLMACEVSAYSLISTTAALKPLFNRGGAILAMTYHGSQQVLRGYNVMGVAKAALECSARYLAEDLGEDGIRVNCISAGPIKTLAASGLGGIRKMIKLGEEKSPLKSNVTIEDVGKSAAYLVSDYAAGVTGQVLYVDSGLSILGILEGR